MKKLLLLAATGLILFNAQAQILKKIADKTKQKVEQTSTNTTGQTTATIDTQTDDPASTTTPAQPQGLQAYSKYDFVQGEKIVAVEDFQRVNVGDFPSNWNTNGSAEVVTLNNREGKWLRINGQGTYLPEFITNIPDNSTLEFDYIVSDNYDWSSPSLIVSLTHLENRSDIENSGYNSKLTFELHPMIGANYSGGINFRTEHSATELSNQVNVKGWDNKVNTAAHLSFWRQGQRLRLYINGSKVLDLPRVFDANGKYTDLVFHTNDFSQDRNDFILLGNFRLAEGAPDTRNKLVSEGRFVTTGIGFDVNSDKIKPASYGVLKEIATTLTENPGLKVKVVGHTDSDGDDAKNLELSRRRAASVKNALVAEFKVDASRLETDGLGETKPVGDNKTPEGKAQNRRVEFIKI